MELTLSYFRRELGQLATDGLREDSDCSILMQFSHQNLFFRRKWHIGLSWGWTVVIPRGLLQDWVPGSTFHTQCHATSSSVSWRQARCGHCVPLQMQPGLLHHWHSQQKAKKVSCNLYILIWSLDLYCVDTFWRENICFQRLGCSHGSNKIKISLHVFPNIFQRWSQQCTLMNGLMACCFGIPSNQAIAYSIFLHIWGD